MTPETDNIDLDRDAIVTVEDRPLVKVPVPAWGGNVYLRAMSAAERDRYDFAVNLQQREMQEDPANPHVRAMLVQRCLCDAKGALLFADTPEDLDILAGKHGRVLDELFDECAKMNGLYAFLYEDLEKNSETTQGDDSVSA